MIVIGKNTNIEERFLNNPRFRMSFMGEYNKAMIDRVLGFICNDDFTRELAQAYQPNNVIIIPVPIIITQVQPSLLSDDTMPSLQAQEKQIKEQEQQKNLTKLLL